MVSSVIWEFNYTYKRFTNLLIAKTALDFLREERGREEEISGGGGVRASPLANR